MPFTTEQLVTGANYTLNTYERKSPIDQVNEQHTMLSWLISKKRDSMYGNGLFREPLYTTNSSNYQNYWGSDQVTYNERDPAKFTSFKWYNHHDGFFFDEDRLAANGIILTDDRSAVPSGAEKDQLVNLLEISYRSLKESIQTGLAKELYRDGTQSSKACPGLEHLVQTLSVDWATNGNTVGGIDSATTAYWRNQVSTGISAGTNLLEGTQEFEKMWRNCRRYGGLSPNKIVAGSAFIDAYRLEVQSLIGRRVNDGGVSKGGASFDAATENLYFHGIPIEWDPTLDTLDTDLSTTTRAKTCYLLNDQAITLRPLKGSWMVQRKPERLPDRYVHYWAKTSKYGLTTNRRTALGILKIS